MKRYIHYCMAFLLGISLLTSCSTEDETTAVSHGEADFSTYVAFGNSLTSGYANNALYYEGQMNSYPKLMAEKMKQVGGGNFKQPLVDPGSVGIGSSGNARLILKVENGSLTPEPVAPSGDFSIFTTSVASEGPYNNMGVPGATVITAIYPGYGNPSNGTGNFNPFFTRMTTDPANASMLSDAVAQNPTFFTVFLGNNDVLNYAGSGGAGESITPMDGGPGVGFAASYDAIISAFTANGAKGALANIPDVTSAPFFTTIPYNALALKDQSQVDALNAAYAPLIQAGLVKKFQLGANPFIIVDDNVPGGMRSMKSDELLLLTTPQDELANGLGSITPIPDQYVLTEAELTKIHNATQAFNDKIKAEAQSHNLAFVDVNAFLKKVKNEGLYVNGHKVNADFVTGGVFSLDGIHLTPLGNVLLANKFIEAINAQYHAFIPEVDPADYGSVPFP